MAIIMDGKALAVNMQEQLQEKVARLKEKEWTVPGLVVIMVGENPASQVYVRNKERAAKKAGFHSKTVNLSESISEEELIEVLKWCLVHQRELWKFSVSTMLNWKVRQQLSLDAVIL